MLKNYRKNYKGFTLLELLVVVLIIGILAAIALPQYRLAVGKSKYATLKNITKSLKESTDRYYLVNGSFPTRFADLDIGLDITKESLSGNALIIQGNNLYCELWGNGRVICYKNIAGKNMRYICSNKRECDTYSLDTNDIPNRICQAETGKGANQADCDDSKCKYYY